MTERDLDLFAKDMAKRIVRAWNPMTIWLWLRSKHNGTTADD